MLPKTLERSRAQRVAAAIMRFGGEADVGDIVKETTLTRFQVRMRLSGVLNLSNPLFVCVLRRHSRSGGNRWGLTAAGLELAVGDSRKNVKELKRYRRSDRDGVVL